MDTQHWVSLGALVLWVGMGVFVVGWGIKKLVRRFRGGGQ